MDAWCHCRWLLLVPGCRTSWAVDCLVSLSLVVVSSWLSDVGCRVFVDSSWLSDVGCRVFVVDCLVSLVVVSSWLLDVRMSVVGCWLLIAWCRCRWLLLVPCCQMSVVGRWLLIARCRCRCLLLAPGCWMSIVGCWLLIASVSLSLFVVSSLLSDVGRRVLVMTA